MSEIVLGGHTASVNVVRWGGAGKGKCGVLYTASSDRSVRVWDGEKVCLDAEDFLRMSFGILSVLFLVQ